MIIIINLLMSKNWIVHWNYKLYDYEKLIRDYKNNNHSGIIHQCKGLAKMVKIPKIGDYAYVKCNKLKIMKCKIISNFVIGFEEECDKYNIGKKNNRQHSTNNEYLAMQIVEIYENPIELRHYGQRTWVSYSI